MKRPVGIKMASALYKGRSGLYYLDSSPKSQSEFNYEKRQQSDG